MNVKKEIFVKKASGKRAPFSFEKIRRSLQKSGADESTVKKILEALTNYLYDNITTKELYQRAFLLLRQISKHHAARYKLKQAIMELGPSGFPFEKYVAEILHVQGYAVEVGKIVGGKCVNHEIDVIAKKGDEYFMVECKYHNEPGTMSDVKIPLYIHSRFNDVEHQWTSRTGTRFKFNQGWVVTNTKFTQDAIHYGVCAGLKLVGWDYPNIGNLKDTVDKLALYPITCLTSLTQSEKRTLLDQRIVLCQEISNDKTILSKLGVSPSRIKAVIEEAKGLCRATC